MLQENVPRRRDLCCRKIELDARLTTVAPSEELDSFTLGLPWIGLTVACRERRALPWPRPEVAQLAGSIAISTKDC